MNLPLVISQTCNKLFQDQCNIISSSSVSVEPVTVPTNNTSFLDSFSRLSEIVYTFFLNFNYIVLTLSVFYSFVLVVNFFYWRVFQNNYRLEWEAKGVKSIQNAWQIWYRYLISLFILTIASFFIANLPVFILAIISYILVIIWKGWLDIKIIVKLLGDSLSVVTGDKKNAFKDLAKKMNEFKFGAAKKAK